MKEKRVVAVSGGFDPLHVGHLQMLQEARALGDKLVVIVNNDNWLKAKKGFVFMPEAERSALIAAYPFVDRVVLTDHIVNDPDRSVSRMLEQLRPDIFANGGDRGETNTPEADVAKRVGIKMHYGIGGGKKQSSSWMTSHAFEEMHTVHRPWGSYRNHLGNDAWHLKTLHLNAGTRLSLQRHSLREELWVLVQGDAIATQGDSLNALTQFPLSKGVPFKVPVGSIHRLESKNGCSIVEIMYGTYDEEDIERLEDDYGRTA